MGVRRPYAAAVADRTRRGRQTQRRLLDAGAEVFARRGYHAARVDDIVKLADTSHGTFYLYFSGKQDLFRQLADEVADQIGALADELGTLTPDAEGHRALVEWIRSFDRAYRRSGPVILTWTVAETTDSEIGRLGEEVVGRLTTALAKRIEAAAVEDLDPEVAALALVSMIERLGFYRHSGNVRMSSPVAAETLAAVVFSALFGRPAPELVSPRSG